MPNVSLDRKPRIFNCREKQYGADSSGYFVFDVTGSSAGSSGTWFDGATIDILYNTTSFGDSIYTKGGVYISNYSSFPSSIYKPHPGDIGYDTLGIFFGTDASLSAPSRTFLTSTPVKLYHVRMKVLHCGINAVIDTTNDYFASAVSYFTNNQTDNYSIGVPYTNTIYSGTYNTPIACTGPQITSISPNSVIAGAYYTGISPNEAQLTINGFNFGSTMGTVFMANALKGHQSTPTYIQLDNYDLTWSNNQIVINVPSVLFASNPNPDGYPGTGYVKVLPASGTDTASSQILGNNGIVKIPYCLTNAYGTTIKRRVAFAYQHVLDSARNADTAAYIFRFDPNTITHNADSLCRPLLKQAIKDWACLIPIRYRIGRDTTIANGYAIQDGISYITFDNSLSDTNGVAETKVKSVSCGTNSFSSEADIHFLKNPTKPWYYIPLDSVPTGYNLGNYLSGKNDFFSVSLHELGHASLLKHVNDSTDLMYWVNYSGTPRQYISSNDYDGAYDNLAWSKTVSFSGSCTYSPFTIPASGSGGCADPSTGVTGIETIGNSTFQISVYPNPAGDYLNVTFIKDKESSNTVKLSNTLGQTIFYRNIGKNEGANEVINLAGLAKGVYILIVTDNQNTLTKKIIVE